MKDPKEHIDRFDQYLDDTLSEEERKIFLDELKKNHELKKEFDEHCLLVDGIRQQGRLALQQKMHEWDLEIDEQEGSGSRTIQGFRWYYAAAALLILVISSLLINNLWNESHEELIAAYYTPYTYIPETTRGEPDAARKYEDIYHQYDLKQYRSVVSRIEAIDQSNRSTLMMFILGSAYQALGEEENAVPVYQGIIKGNSSYVNGATWYLALCHLSLGQVESAKDLLQKLQSSQSSYAKKAQQILSDL